jgi:hypothetical protein
MSARAGLPATPEALSRTGRLSCRPRSLGQPLPPTARSSQLCHREIIVTEINKNQHHSRPSHFTLLIAVGIFFGIGVILYWAEISDFAHIPQIKQTLGL